MKHNYNEKLLVKTSEGKYVYRCYENAEILVTSQSCEALPLYWGMVPEDKEQDIVEAFRESLVDKKAFAAGEVGLPYIIQVASKYGMNDLISDYITKPEHPSYYAFVLDGLNTLFLSPLRVV